MERHEADEIVAMLVGAFPDAKWSDETQSIYAQALVEHPFDAAKRAIMRLVASLKFRPSIAEVLSACVDVQHGAKRGGLEAWADICAAIRKYGQYRTPKLDDDKARRAMEMIGGWRYVCLSENEMSDRARFVEAYDALADRERVDVASGIALPSPSQHARLNPTTLRDLPEWEPNGSETQSTT